MSDATPSADAKAAMLEELAGIVMDATRRAHERLKAAETDEAFHDAARTVQRMARAVRQTLALSSRFERERVIQDREAAAEAAVDRVQRIKTHRDRIRIRVESDWEERQAEFWADEADDFDPICPIELEQRLDAAELDDNFLSTPVEVLVDRVLASLGLPADTSAEPPPGPPGEPVPVYSSA